ncbi:hypothetical protein [Maricaulis sp.]|uniref:beta family protein n=1 Tax=Maricaulis sp. TaxID=1486257 RepID=UPI001B0F383D|nr:hypothetical protein [Maricaulis sp.]MBO6764062.1 hypothetical protein [Maricaulis sp.]
MLEAIDYVPILHTRVAEIKALKNVPTLLKDLTLPVLVLRPWQNASRINFFWDKVEDAIARRPFALDLDWGYELRENRSADQEFGELRNPDNGFQQYFDFVRGGSNFAIPVIQHRGADGDCFREQVDRANTLGRGAFYRMPVNDAGALVALQRYLLDEVERLVIVVDAGWGSHILEHELSASRLVEMGLAATNPPEFVIAGSSFPDSFGHILGRAEIPIRERQLYNAVSRRHNEAELTYGDWGSTRPPSRGGGGGEIPPRIDWPRLAEWVCFRASGGETYQDMANAVLEEDDWDADHSSWGMYLIQATAEGAPNAIRTPGAAAAARINLHLISQAAHEVHDWTEDDEPYPDD